MLGENTYLRTYRAVWPLLLAANGDAGAAAATGNARRIGLAVNRVNRGILGYADAILAGRAGNQHQATELALAADRELRHYPVWADLARLCAAEPALADGWGQPRQWLEIAAGMFPGTGSSRWRCGAAGCWNSRHRAAGPGWASPTGRPTYSGS